MVPSLGFYIILLIYRRKQMKRVFLALLLVLSTSWAFSQAQSEVKRVDEAATKTLISEGAVVLDVRTKAEWDEGHLPMAKLLPVDEISASKAAALVPSKATKVVVYCRSGRRSAQAAQTLRGLGYAVYDLGAITNWRGPLAR